MIQAFAENVFQAFVRPRESARRIMTIAPDLTECLLMVVLAFAIQSGVTLLVVMLDGAQLPSVAIGQRISELVLQVMLYGIMVVATWTIGQRFGGVADQAQISAVIAWHYLVTACLAPLNALGMRAAMEDSSVPGIFFIAVPFSVALSVWLFASFVAEAHGFRSIGGVIGASILGFLALGVVTMLLLGLFGLGPQP